MSNRKNHRGLRSVISSLKDDDVKPKPAGSTAAAETLDAKPQTPKSQIETTDFPEAVALDCEMVGCGPEGRISVLGKPRPHALALVDPLTAIP